MRPGGQPNIAHLMMQAQLMNQAQLMMQAQKMGPLSGGLGLPGTVTAPR